MWLIKYLFDYEIVDGLNADNTVQYSIIMGKLEKNLLLQKIDNI